MDKKILTFYQNICLSGWTYVNLNVVHTGLILKVPITTAADDKFYIFSNFSEK